MAGVNSRRSSKNRRIALKYSRDDMVLCPECKEYSTLGEWEDITLENCISRHDRRHYTSLLDAGAWNKGKGVAYMCPQCRKFQHSYQLRRVAADKNDTSAGQALENKEGASLNL